MKKWVRILLGLFALDAVVMVFAMPLATLWGLDNERMGSGAPIIRFFGGIAAGVLLVVLLVAWNLKHTLPK